MPTANTTPIFVGQHDNGWLQTDGNGGAAGPLKTQNLALDGTGTVLTIFTADATNGSVVTMVTLRAAGTNIPTVARFFLNNGSTSATIGNNSLIDELSLPTVTAATASATPPFIWIPPGGILRMKAAYVLNVTLGTTVAAGYVLTAFGGKMTY